MGTYSELGTADGVLGRLKMDFSSLRRYLRGTSRDGERFQLICCMSHDYISTINRAITSSTSQSSTSQAACRWRPTLSHAGYCTHGINELLPNVRVYMYVRYASAARIAEDDSLKRDRGAMKAKIDGCEDIGGKISSMPLLELLFLPFPLLGKENGLTPRNRLQMSQRCIGLPCSATSLPTLGMKTKL